MSRPHKPNQVPQAPFSLHSTGPLSEQAIRARLGTSLYRAANGRNLDARATVDAEPCPHCGALVEWSRTTRMEGGEAVRYLYGRCRQDPQGHRWDFRHLDIQTDPRRTPPGTRPAANLQEAIAKVMAELERLKRGGY